MKITKRNYIWGAAGLIVVIGLGAGVLWAVSGNKGQILEAPARQATRAPAYKDFDGTYIAFRYKGTYQAQTLPAKDADLELAMLVAATNYDKRLAVAVSQLPGGNLNNNSAYLLRKSQPGLYTSRQLTVAGAPATVWVKADNQEQTVFIPHNDKVAMLSFTTAGRFDDLNPEVAALLQTFHWK
jgi:hypothetical protein